MEKESIRKLYQKLTKGDIDASLQVYEKYSEAFDASDFLDKILKPVMNKIEDDFAHEKISIAEAHIAKNVAKALVKIITDMENEGR